MRLLCLRLTLKGKRLFLKAPSALSNAFIRKNRIQISDTSNTSGNLELTQAQMNLLSRGLKFILTPATNENHIRTQLLNDFKAFARGMRLQYVSYGQDKEPHSFHVKSNWEPPVQLSITLESYLEEVKTELAEVKISKRKNSLPINERQALTELSRTITLLLKRRIREPQ